MTTNRIRLSQPQAALMEKLANGYTVMRRSFLLAGTWLVAPDGDTETMRHPNTLDALCKLGYAKQVAYVRLEAIYAITKAGRAAWQTFLQQREESGEGQGDALQEFITERTRKNPNFPAMVEAAAQRHELLRKLDDENTEEEYQDESGEGDGA